MALPIFMSPIKELTLMQTSWSTAINPLLAQALSSASILKSVSLVSGSNRINHLLSRKLQGWLLVRQRSAASIYDTQDSNPTPELTLQLQASANVTVDILVF